MYSLGCASGWEVSFFASFFVQASPFLYTSYIYRGVLGSLFLIIYCSVYLSKKKSIKALSY